MRNVCDPIARADLIADALWPTIAELRLVDASDLVAFVAARKWANLADVIASSAELSLKPGSLTFDCRGEFALGWHQGPAISLDLEFQAIGLSAFFTLTMGRRNSAIDLKALWFASEPPDCAEGTRRLAAALEAARIGTPVPARIFLERR